MGAQGTAPAPRASTPPADPAPGPDEPSRCARRRRRAWGQLWMAVGGELVVVKKRMDRLMNAGHGVVNRHTCGGCPI